MPGWLVAGLLARVQLATTVAVCNPHYCCCLIACCRFCLVVLRPSHTCVRYTEQLYGLARKQLGLAFTSDRVYGCWSYSGNLFLPCSCPGLLRWQVQSTLR